VLLDADVAQDPKAFTQFLVNHPRIKRVELDVNSWRGPIAALTTRPIALPQLTHIVCLEPQHLIPLLDALHISPNLSAPNLPFRRFSPSSALVFKHALRRLSLHVSPVHIEFNAEWWFNG
jgi:hypothetical protein